MININEIKDLVSKALPNRKATALFDYDENYYIVAAPLKNVEKDRNGSFFKIVKSSGKILPFSPGEDYDKFFDAIDNKGIKL